MKNRSARIIDADGHVRETDEEIIEYMSAGYRNRRDAMLYFPLTPHHGWHRSIPANDFRPSDFRGFVGHQIAVVVAQGIARVHRERAAEPVGLLINRPVLAMAEGQLQAIGGKDAADHAIALHCPAQFLDGSFWLLHR